MRRMGQGMTLFAKPASGMESQQPMKAKLAGMGSRGEQNTFLPSGWKMKTVLCGNTVY